MDYFFAQALTDICQHSLVCPERPLRCIIIVNPAAGGFNIRSKWENRVQTLKEYRQKRNINPQRQIYKNIILNITEGKGSASEITKSFIDRAIKDPVPFYLIISAGGDGTHGEVMNAVYKAPVNVRRTMAVLRLPMGTGNDGADFSELSDALDLLLKPSHIKYAPAVQLITAPKGPTSWKGPFLAYNICSIGLDAYVTHKTNEMKRSKPGDSYKFWVNMAALSYDKKYKVDLTEIKVIDEKNNTVHSLTEKILLLAMGVTGNRSYGAQQHILPDSRNVCVIKQMPFLRKLVLKGLVVNGNHLNCSEALFFNAQRLEIMAKHPILAQMDGETIFLKPEDFPIKMELTAPVIPLLKFGSAKE